MRKKDTGKEGWKKQLRYFVNTYTGLIIIAGAALHQERIQVDGLHQCIHLRIALSISKNVDFHTARHR